MAVIVPDATTKSIDVDTQVAIAARLEARGITTTRVEVADDKVAEVAAEVAAADPDAVIIFTLAAEQAGSVTPADIAAQLPEVTTTGEQCTTFAECKSLIGAGTDIDYVGPGGPYEISPRTGRPTASL